MEREALMRSIIENPDDDVARLVFADWLEENGEPERAEFIRLQIQLHDIDRGDPLYRVQWRRYWQLVQQCETEWKSQLPALPSGLEWGPFRRGFVDELQLNHGQPYEPFPRVEPNDIPLTRIRCPIQWVDMKLILGEHLQRVREWDLDFEDQPFRLFINGGPGEQGEFLNEWTRSRTRRSMTRFNLRGGHSSTEWFEIIATSNWPALRYFGWYNHPVNPNVGIIPICRATWLSQLIHAEWEYHRFPEGAFAELCRNLKAGHLRRLTLRGCSLTDADALTLARSGLLAGLSTLDLGNNQIGPAGATAIIYELPLYARVLFDQNSIGDAGLTALAESPSLTRLSELRCGRGELGNDALISLANSPYAANLTLLFFPGQQIDSEGASAILNSSYLPRLELLNLENNRITTLPTLNHSRIATLPLSHNPLTESSVERFCTESDASALMRLSLDGIPAAVRGVTALMSNDVFPSLEYLSVRDCGIGDIVIRSWFVAPRLRTLKRFSIVSDGNPISGKVLKAFQQHARANGCEVS